MTSRGDVRCAHCNGPLKVHDCYRRHYRDDGGKRHYGWVAQGRCDACDVYPALIPEFLMPHKHYEAAVIEGVIMNYEDKEPLSDCAADNSTMRRWINQFKERGARAVGWLLSALFTVYGRYISALEMQNRSLLKQLARLLSEYPVPEGGAIIGRANIVLTMYNYGFL
jgi:hypothetical protein